MNECTVEIADDKLSDSLLVLTDKKRLRISRHRLWFRHATGRGK